jgi:hypothetical protein
MSRRSRKQKSSAVYHIRQRGPASKLAIAIKSIASAAGNTSTAGMFGQVRKVTVNNSLILSSEAGYDIDFDVPFDDDPEVNEAEIKIYNLTDNTIAQFAVDTPILLDAGYTGDTVANILNGKIKKCESSWEDLDRVTTITCTDYNGAADTQVQDISYPKKTSASTILQDLAKRLGIPVAKTSLPRDQVFDSAVKISGSLMDAIGKYAKACGAEAWVCKSALYLCPVTQAVTDDYFDLRADTGLISVSTWQEKEEIDTGQKDSNKKAIKQEVKTDGADIKMLLQNRIYTGALIQLTSTGVNGKFRVREGSHSADGTDFYTTVKAVRVT